MSVTDSIVSELKANAAVTALVGAKVYADYAYAKAATPYIVVNEISAVRYPHLTASSGHVESRVQVDCVASTRNSREAVGDAVRETLYTKTGAIGTSPNDISVGHIDLEEDRNEVTMPDSGPKRSGQRGTFTRSMDFMVWHTETVPTF